ncbi:hypothetical protein HDF09_004036 [Edaphobacter lichenicola]|uniref:Uncharacterized protein n=1 Tax=Tunturiibacter empetritectus TaxID=3069691 RepID=A0A7W8MTY1_9BACT|nr:hypothetical protein [Edaphobacter lichenicola]
MRIPVRYCDFALGSQVYEDARTRLLQLKGFRMRAKFETARKTRVVRCVYDA